MRILFSAGTQLPFDRLKRVAESMAVNNPLIECFFQGSGGECCDAANLKGFEFVSQEEFKKIIVQSDLVVSHAGMGNVINVVDMGKDVVIFPRQKNNGEHRNDHQMDTALALKEKLGIVVAYSVEEAISAINEKLAGKTGFLGYDVEEIESRRRRFAGNLKALVLSS